MVVGAQQDPVVVVGCDGSWESMDAVDIGVRAAVTRDQPLVVVTVEDGPNRQVRQLGDWARATEEGERDAASIGRRVLERVGSRWAATTTVSASSAASPVLDELAARASLLVVGRHGARGVGAFSSGSMSEQLVRRFGCPVVVAGNPTASGFGHRAPSAMTHPKVVVGVDDEPSAGIVLEVAVAEAQRRGWALTVVYAAGRSQAELHVLASRIWERHSNLLLAERAPDHSLARVVVDVDDAVSALVMHVGPQDLLVVGTQGEGRLAGLVPGSVARGVLDQMPCDVMVVPPSAVAGRATDAATDRATDGATDGARDRWSGSVDLREHRSAERRLGEQAAEVGGVA